MDKIARGLLQFKIIHLVVSVCPSVHLSVCLMVLSCLNRLSFDPPKNCRVSISFPRSVVVSTDCALAVDAFNIWKENDLLKKIIDDSAMPIWNSWHVMKMCLPFHERAVSPNNLRRSPNYETSVVKPWQLCRTIGPLLSHRFLLAGAKAQPRGAFCIESCTRHTNMIMFTVVNNQLKMSQT